MNQSHSYKDERSYTVKVTVSDTSGKQPVAFGAGQTTVTISKEPDMLSVLKSSKYLFVALGGFAALPTISGQSMEVPTGTLSMQSGPVTWTGLNFTSSYTDGFGGWKMSYSGTAAADGKSLKSLTVETVAEAGGAMTWHWELGNIGNPRVGVDPTYGSAWSVSLQGPTASLTFGERHAHNARLPGSDRAPQPTPRKRHDRLLREAMVGGHWSLTRTDSGAASSLGTADC